LVASARGQSAAHTIAARGDGVRTTRLSERMLARMWDVRRLALTDPDPDGFRRSWIMLFPEGDFSHPKYGELHFTARRLADIKRQFDSRVRHIDIALDANHDQDKATGWLERLEMRAPTTAPDGEALPAGLWGLVRWTPLGVQYLRDQIYRYFSPEFGPWEDPATGREYADVLMGGGLTNRPFLKNMPAVALAEQGAGPAISRRPWGAIDKDCLPDSAFLDPKGRRLPVYEGAGPKDARGRYTRRGALNLNGVRAALAAVHGARSGAAMTGLPAGTEATLRGWLARYDKSDSGKAASEGGSRTARRARRTSGDGGMGKRDERDERGRFLAAADEDDETQELDEGGEEFADGADDESEYMDDAEDAADGGADDAEEDDGFDAAADTHGAMTVKAHSHGKYGRHSHSDDGDHSEAPLKAAKGKSMREPRDHGDERPLTLTERAQFKQMREQLETVRYQLYETEVGKTLDGWAKQSFQFREGTKAGKPVAKSGRIALSKAFTESYRAFMLKEGVRLSEGQRRQVNGLIESALSTAVVDLSERAAGTFDQEERRTERRGGTRAPTVEQADRLTAAADRLAREEGKVLAELDGPATLALYERASREIDYR
jgi:hypothetical protein